MSPIIVALCLAVGVSAWTYSKIIRRTGGNTRNDSIVTAVVGIIVFFVSWTIFNSLVG